jgi:hypothetical protein
MRENGMLSTPTQQQEFLSAIEDPALRAGAKALINEQPKQKKSPTASEVREMNKMKERIRWIDARQKELKQELEKVQGGNQR